MLVSTKRWFFTDHTAVPKLRAITWKPVYHVERELKNFVNEPFEDPYYKHLDCGIRGRYNDLPAVVVEDEPIEGIGYVHMLTERAFTYMKQGWKL